MNAAFRLISTCASFVCLQARLYDRANGTNDLSVC